MVFNVGAALWDAVLLTLLFWGVGNPAAAQERTYSVVLPELQYAHHCSSEIQLHNVSPRFVDVDVIGHKSTGAIVGLLERNTNHFRLSPSETAHVRLDVEDDTAWAQIDEIVPHPRLQPVLAVSAFTECLDGNERLSEPREIAATTRDPRFSLDPTTAAASGTTLLMINDSTDRVEWSACYSAGTEVSNGNGQMTMLCSQTLESTLAAYQSCHLATSVEGKPLVRFRAHGPSVAVQVLTQSSPRVQLYKVESRIHFDMDDPAR